jgi:putative ABC transport system permease protein
MSELKMAVRQLLRTPGFTILALIILGLGIGANTAMFSLINVLLFKPLTIEHPDELVRVHSRSLKPGEGHRSFSYPNFVEVRSQNDVFRDLTAFAVSMVGLTEGETTRRVFAVSVAANYFSTFAARPVLGRGFLPEEEQPGAGLAVAVVGHNYWKRHGSDPGVLGQTLTVNGRSFEIVGVAPEGFSGTSVLLSPELFVPLGVHEWMRNDFMDAARRPLTDRENHCLLLAGRLKEGITPETAEARLEGLGTRLREAYPKENADQALQVSRPSRLSVNVAPGNDAEVRTLTLLLLPMSGIVLLIASLNLANMLLARGTARRKEFAIRSALGGGRLRIIRQLLTEGVLLSLMGGVVALLLSNWVTVLMIDTFASKIPFLTIAYDGGLDFRVLAATFAFCLMATLVATLTPALRLSKVDVMRDLKEQAGDGGHAGHIRKWLSLRSLLVTGQVALSFVLLMVAGLFYRGASKAAEANPGFRFEQGVVVELDSSLAGYDEAESRRVYRSVLERVRQIPGVRSASLASSIPFGMFSDGRQVGRPGTRQALDEGVELSEADRPVYANYTLITDGYFQSLGTSILRGREFNSQEAEGSAIARVAIVNEAVAEKLWPGEDAVGRQLELLDGRAGAEPMVVEVVGVAPGFKAAIGDQEASPYLYLPLGQAFQSMLNLHVRLAQPDLAAEKAMVGTLRSVLKATDPRLPVLSINTLRDFYNEGLVMWMFETGCRLFLTFALVALLLAVAGVYGVKSFVVARRTREIGIRMALGATTGQVLWMILREGMRLTAIGLALGCVLALGAGQLLRSMLFGVSAADPVSLGVALVVLTVASLAASYLPARRAARIQPMRALHCE